MKKRLRLIITGFSVSFAIMASLSLFAINQFTSLIDYSTQVDHTNITISKLFEIQSDIKEVDVLERGYMITKDSAYLLELFALSRGIIPKADSLKSLIDEDKTQRTTLILLKERLTERKDIIKQNLQLLDTSHSRDVSPYFIQGREIRNQIIKQLNDMMAHENELLKKTFSSKKYYEQITHSTIRYLLTIFAIVTIILFVLMVRELRRRLMFQDELQAKVADLKRSHDELEQIAHAVSHDLQEPLRKIQIMSNRLVYVKKEEIDDDTKQTLDRINTSASRMHELIDDLMNLTSLVKEEQMEEVNLNEALAYAVEDLKEKVDQKRPVINVDQLPTVHGHSKQLQAMFRALLDNSLKFSRGNITPVIAVSCETVSGAIVKERLGVNGSQKFYEISFADNGIGFENKFTEKMFRIFQILHKRESEYAGKGIGLAICQRVMVNHEGYITAHGQPGRGATFNLYFPVKE